MVLTIHRLTTRIHAMKAKLPLISHLLVGLALTAFGARAAGQPATPPPGFRAIFNGRDLTGWYGLNPHNGANLKGDKKKANLAQQRAEFPKYWTVANGELINDGHGPYATTEEEFGDIDLHIEY